MTRVNPRNKRVWGQFNNCVRIELVSGVSPVASQKTAGLIEKETLVTNIHISGQIII